VRCGVCPDRHWIPAEEAEPFYPEAVTVPRESARPSAEATDFVDDKGDVVYVCPAQSLAN